METARRYCKLSLRLVAQSHCGQPTLVAKKLLTNNSQVPSQCVNGNLFEDNGVQCSRVEQEVSLTSFHLCVRVLFCFIISLAEF